MSDEAPSLLNLLTIEPNGVDRYLAPTPRDGWGRLFGGQVASQSVRAATLTVEPERQVHSLHAYFIRPGKPSEPLQLEVDRTRDGRSFTTRRVTASQSDGPIFVLAASFAIDEEGEEWQPPAPLDVPGPDDVDTTKSFFTEVWARSPLDVRAVHPPLPDQPPVIHPLWLRTKTALPDDPASNAGARGLALGTMHTRNGTLVATIAQEALLRGTGRVPMP